MLSESRPEKDAVKLNEERGKVPSVEEGHDAERHVGGVWRAERRCQSWRRDKMSAVKLAKEFHGGDTSSYPRRVEQKALKSVTCVAKETMSAVMKLEFK